MLSLRVADVEDPSGGKHTACRDDRFEGRVPPAAHYFGSCTEYGTGVVSRPITAATPRARLALTRSSDAHGRYCAENTAMHPCAQLLPDESL